MYSFCKQGLLLINSRFYDFLVANKIDDFHRLMNMKGDSLHKKNKYRSVVSFQIEGKTFYLKRHFWPLSDKVKYLLSFHQREDARNEWNNMLLLDRLGFRTVTPVAFGEQQVFGLPKTSLTLTEKLYDAEPLEKYVQNHFIPPLTEAQIRGKRALIRQLAELTRDFHDRGLHHQDFYLGHLFIHLRDHIIHILDIQRVHHRKVLRKRHRVKDLAQLLFSAQGLGVFTAADGMRFAHVYFGRKKLLRHDKHLIRGIAAKSRRIEKHTVKLLERRKRSG